MKNVDWGEEGHSISIDWDQREEKRRERDMSQKPVYVKQCIGVNGLEKIILKEVRGFSAEVFHPNFNCIAFNLSYHIV